MIATVGDDSFAKDHTLAINGVDVLRTKSLATGAFHNVDTMVEAVEGKGITLSCSHKDKKTAKQQATRLCSVRIVSLEEGCR